ncbi:class II aldolase/adducin family protein [Variovorax sp. LjRoot84]|uniref:class II aldolase/adducin family protein n=1 Tax=Variovorax sp. LjRoot84 TaxID=3342340 RepID=UPI003ECD5B65
MASEISASSLVKVNVRGEVVDGSGARVNPIGFAIHGAVHAARPEVAATLNDGRLKRVLPGWGCTASEIQLAKIAPYHAATPNKEPL